MVHLKKRHDVGGQQRDLLVTDEALLTGIIESQARSDSAMGLWEKVPL